MRRPSPSSIAWPKVIVWTEPGCLPSRDVAQQQVEGRGFAVVGRDHVNAAAPGEEGKRRLEHLFQIVDEGGLVYHRPVSRAALGPERPGRTGHRRDGLARGEPNPEDLHRLGIARIEHALANAAGLEVKMLRPLGTVVDEAARHLLVVGLIDHVAAVPGGVHHRVVSLGPGQADTARLLDDLELGRVGDPAALVGQQRAAHAEPSYLARICASPSADSGVLRAASSRDSAGAAFSAASRCLASRRASSRSARNRVSRWPRSSFS